MAATLRAGPAGRCSVSVIDHVELPPSQDVVPLSTWVLICNFKLLYKLLRRADGSLNRDLDEDWDIKMPASFLPVGGVSSIDVVVDMATEVWGRVFWEPQDQHTGPSHTGEGNGETDSSGISQQLKPLVIYFHGGSFVHSSANSGIYDAMCRRLVKMCGVVILSVNFRRAPENRYPCAYEDGLTSLQWAQSFEGLTFLGRLGCGPLERCFLAGDSAGGNIAHNVAVRAANEGLPLAGTVLLMPMFGGQKRTPAEMLLDGHYFVTMSDRDWYWRAFLPLGATRDHPACNPFSRHAPSLHDVNLPPCLVVIGGYDLLQDWQLNFVQSLREAGQKVFTMFLEDAAVGFFLFPNSDLFYTLVERVRTFLNAHR